ncbi:hypothetical protein CHUAL_010036 [Chamberlinius hualienensis]
MEDAGIVPFLIPVAPKDTIKVVYPGNVMVRDGDELTPTQVRDKPLVEFTGDSNKFYTLIMTDPDAPSRSDPIYKEVLHWLVVNIPGNSLAKGEMIADYIGAGPPQDSGLHRYIFLVYEQPGRITVDLPRSSITSVKNRLKFETSEFAEKYKLGEPKAGNFFQAQYDDWVPKLRSQFTE